MLLSSMIEELTYSGVCVRTGYQQDSPVSRINGGKHPSSDLQARSLTVSYENLEVAEPGTVSLVKKGERVAHVWINELLTE